MFLFAAVQASAGEQSSSEGVVELIQQPQQGTATFSGSMTKPKAQSDIKMTELNELAPARPLTEKEVLETIKKQIKPVEFVEGDPTQDISIKYEIPRKELDTSLSAVGNTSFLNLNVDTSEKNELSENEISVQAYKAALMGQYEAAVALYKKALAKDPENVSYLYSIGAVYQKLAQYNDAKVMYKKVLAIDPNHKSAMSNYIILMSEQQPGQAILELKQLENANPKFSPVIAQIGMLYAKTEQYDMAEGYMRKAVEISPDIINYRYNLAVLYDKMGNMPAALQLYTELTLIGGSDLLPGSKEYIRSRIAYLQSQVNSK